MCGRLTLEMILLCSVSGHPVSKSSYCMARTSHCQDPEPAGRLVQHLLHSHTVWLQGTQIGESKHTVTHFILNMLGSKGFYSHVWYFKMCFPHLHFKKNTLLTDFCPPETNFKQDIIEEKLHSVKAFL